jgi:hypothetical protein
MADSISRLGLEIDSGPVGRAISELDRFDAAGNRAGEAADAFARAGAAASAAAKMIEAALAGAARQMTATSNATKQVEQTVAGASGKMRGFASEAEAIRRVQAYMDGVASRARALTTAMNPLIAEQAEYNRALDEANRLFRQGAISASTYQKAVAAARSNYQSAGIRESQRTGVDQSGINSLLGVRSADSSAGSARDSAEAFRMAAEEEERFASAAAAVKAQVDPLAAATDRLNAELALYEDLAQRGYLSTTQLAAAQEMAQQGFHRTAAAAGAASGNMRLSGHEVTNIGMQLNDLGVQLASGSSPFMAIIQQGAQIGQTLGPTGTLGGALKALGPAIVAFVTNPINLAIVALAGAAYGATKLWEAMGNGRSAEDTLKDVADAISDIAKGYRDATEAAQDFVSDPSLGEFAARTRRSVGELTTMIRTELQTVFEASFSRNLFGSISIDFEEFRKPYQDLTASIVAGQPAFDAFQDTISALVAARPNDEAFRKAADALILAASKGAEYQRTLDQVLETQKRLTPEALRLAAALKAQGEAWETFGEMMPDTRSELDRLNESFFKLRQSGISGDEIRSASKQYDAAIKELGRSARDAAREASEGLSNVGLRDYARGLAEINQDFDRQIAEAIRTQGEVPGLREALEQARTATLEAFRQDNATGPIREATDALNEQVAALQIHSGAMGRSYLDMDKAAAAQDLLNQYMRAGVPITAEMAAQIDEIAAASARAAQAERALQLQQDLLFERQRMFRSPGEQDIADRLRGAQIDANSAQGEALANYMRQNQALEEMIDRLDEVREAGGEAFRTIIDGIRQGASGGEIFANVLDGIADKFADAAEQSLTDAFFGKAGTLDGGIFGNLFGFGAGGGALEMGTMANPMWVQVVGGGLLGGLGGASGGAAGLLGDITGSVGGAASTTSQGGVAAQVWNYFAQKGLPPQSVAAIVGHSGAESSFNPSAVGDNGSSFGLFQHHAERGQGLLASIGGQGNLGNVQGQLDYVWQELQTTERRTLDALMSAQDTRQATAAFAGFERPAGWSPGNPEGAHNFAGRLQGAEEALAKFGGTVGNAETKLGDFGQTIDEYVTGTNRGGGGPSFGGMSAQGFDFGANAGMFGGGGNYGVALGPMGPTMTTGFAEQAQAQATGFLGGLGQAFSTILGGLGQVGQGFLSGFGSIFQSILSGLGGMGGGGGGGGFLSGLFSIFGGLGGGASVGGLYADGGMISGPGTGRSDSIIARVSTGEFITNAAATRRHLPLLQAINSGALPAFADGGLVGAGAAAGGGMGGLRISVVTSVDQNGNLKSFVREVSRQEAGPIADQSTARGLRSYDEALPGQIRNKQQRGARF